MLKGLMITLVPLAWAAGAQTEATIPAGSELEVRTSQAIDAKTATEGQYYPAVFNRDVTDSAGNVAIPKGSDAQLAVRKISNNELALDVHSVNVNGRQYLLHTGEYDKTKHQGVGKNKRTGEMVGGGAALGTIIGAIAGG